MSKQIFIPESEYKKRLKRAKELLQNTDIDILIVNSNEADFANVRYFSNYWPIFENAGVAITREGRAALLIGPESESYARDRSKIPNIHKMMEYRESADPSYPGIIVSTFNDVFEDLGVKNPKRIGIGGYLVTNLPVHDGLKKAFPKTTIVRADEIMIKLRSIKTEPEIKCLKEAFRIAEIAIDRIIQEIKPGLTELQVVGVAQDVIYTNGAEYEGMPQYVLSGKNSTHAISRASHNLLKKDELIQLNISARVDGYSSGVGRPICLGKMNREMKEMVEFGKYAHEQTLEWIHSGVLASEIAMKYKHLFNKYGFLNNFLYGPCHGLGMLEVEPPWIEENSNYYLESNMTFQADTFVQHKNFGLRWENGFCVTNAGVEMFSYKNMNILEL
jgi:Xaa-Pro aminopeptidase